MTAALYVVLTYVSAAFGMSSGAVQVRLSEALCVLPCFMPAAVWGLFAGCLLSNFLTGGIMTDVIFGSLATLIGAFCTRTLRKNIYLSLIPPIISNTLIIPFVLAYAYHIQGTIPYFMMTVGIGEIISCGIFGALLGSVLKKYKIFS